MVRWQTFRAAVFVAAAVLGAALLLVAVASASDAASGSRGGNSDVPYRVAIVGSGISGGASAYALKVLFGDAVEVVVFERGERVGGRTTRVMVDGQQFELGASLFVEENRHMLHFARTFGLELATPDSELAGASAACSDNGCEGSGSVDNDDVRSSREKLLGIWNGAEFVYRESSWSLVSITRAVWRWGVDMLRLNALVARTLERWLRIYSDNTAEQPLRQRIVFNSTEDFYRQLDLEEYLNVDTYTFLTSHGFGDALVRELVEPIARTMYAQNAEINAFAGLVSFIGESGRVYRVKDGHHTVVEHLLEFAGAEVHTNTAVSAISADSDGKLSIVTGVRQYDEFTHVIVATPLEHSGITFTGDAHMEALNKLPVREFRLMHVTFVVGVLSSEYFGTDEVPAEILTTHNDETALFLSIGGWAPSRTRPSHTIYKIFSNEALDSAALARVFSEYDERSVLRHQWHAYPWLEPTVARPPIRLTAEHNVYYANAFESVVSTMETQCISGINIAQLIARGW